MRRLVLPLAVAFALVASHGAAAQGAFLSAAIEPGAVDASAGDVVEARIDVRNDGLADTSVALGASLPGGWNASFEPANLTVPPGGVASARLILRIASDAAAGLYEVRATATETRVGGTSAEATLDVRIQPPSDASPTTTNGTGTTDETSGSGGSSGHATDAAGDPAPPSGPDGPPAATPPQLVVEPERVAPTGDEAAPFEVRVTNTGAATARYSARLFLPLGWTGTIDDAPFTLEPGATRVLQANVRALEGAVADDARVLVDDDDGEAASTVVHLVPPARQAETLRDEEPVVEPVSGGDDDGSPITQTAAPTVRVEPSLLRIAPGAMASAEIVIENRGEGVISLALVLELPPAVLVEAAPADVDVAPGGSARVPFTVRVAADVPPGGEAPGRVRASGATMPVEALFLVRVVEPPPPVEAAFRAQVTEDADDASYILAVALAGLGALALAVGYASRRWPWLFAPLYTRLPPSRVLDHPTRAAMMERVRERPGLTMGELQRDLGLANGALAYHVRRLVRAGLLRIATDGQARRLHPSGTGRVLSVAPLQERLLALLDERGPTSASEAALALDASRQALHYHIRRLEARGLIDARKEGRERILSRTSESRPFDVA